MSWTLLAANDGGHITQLRALADRIDGVGDRLWVTVPTPQTESMLAGERVHWVTPAPTRDWHAAWRNGRRIRHLFHVYDISSAISTGSSVAVSALPHAAHRRIPTHYIESVTRTDGISMSGKILSRVPGISLYVQWPHLARSRWTYRGSVLEGFSVEAAPKRAIKRMVVSLGTSGSFGFRRLVERLVDIVPSDVEVLWQTGSTNVSRLGIESRASVPEAELASAIRDADAVVAHAGAGIALTILGAGKVPLLVPRLASRGEHVDDHQRQIADQMSLRGLAIASDVDGLTWDLVSRATEQQALRKAAAPRFRLDRHGKHTVAPREMRDFDLSTARSDAELQPA